VDAWPFVAVGFVLLWLLTAWLAVRAAKRHRVRVRELTSQRQSQATRYGQITEQFAPFLATWPWDPKRFRFLGDPVDGVQFTDDGVVFVEVKTAGGRLSSVQRQVRDHVEAGRVTWAEVRLR
jgi:predicted Holliday junction resolvase-like endonuclease